MTKLNRKIFLRAFRIVLVVCAIPGIWDVCNAGTSGEIITADSESALTRPSGNAVRKEIMNALRQKVKRIHGIDVVFVVKYLKVKNGWAWTHTQPGSRDGSTRYEDLSALLQIRNGVWTVTEIPCMEEDNPDCLDHADFFYELKKRYPGVPPDILPLPSARE